MVDITVKKIEEFDYYKGEHVRAGIRFIYAGKGLGVTAWGMNIINIQPGSQEYPEHDHETDGQEEVYVVLEGSATLQADTESYDLPRGALVRVGSGQKRKIIPGSEGVTILAIGNTPGKAYEPK